MNFSIPTDSYVSITVYDILGKEVISLVDEHYSIGYHTVTWNASGYSSGIYFVLMRSGEYTKTQKIMLVK